MGKTIVVALGGNAILQPKQKGTFEEQLANVEVSCNHIAELVAAGHRVVVTHGNGPQVGNILAQNAAASTHIPAMPLAVCGAESQGMIGYMIQQSLRNKLLAKGISKEVVTVLTQVRVERNDPAFQNPTKPIGAFFSEEEARRFMAERGETWVEDSGRGWRKVVASPVPVDIVEIETIRRLLESGTIVIASGGGGIPVVLDADGKLVGTDAVIDKDLAGSLLAKKLGADMLMILTDVSKVAINFGKPDQKDLDCITISEGRKMLAEGQFGSGSMAPKVRAAINFAAAGGEAVIASLNEAGRALEGKAGTRIILGEKSCCGCQPA